ncbi:MAG: gliding motility-associated C-terminal domain-containing protein [Bacteroidetes bacterium]|nr:gliding motility-associated C-terminal domain-containing protein [Bacteroidota bacterium]
MELDFFGHYSTTQAALIIPKPNSEYIYYVITGDAHWDITKGVHYSVVDMRLNGGLGDVTEKNILLTPAPTTEKLVGIRHCNGLDYWIITHPSNSSAYNAYLVTSNGIKPTPVVSYGSVAQPIQNGFGTAYENVGYLKASPDGKKLAAIMWDGLVDLEILDFNSATGQITNPIGIGLPNDYHGYGLSFSPDSKKLYASLGGLIYQFDLTNPTFNAIVASKQTIYHDFWDVSGMQLGPDGKIYVLTLPTLSVINNPNSIGSSCNFQHNILPWATWCCGHGFPNFIDGGINSIKLTMPDIIDFCTPNFSQTLDPGPGFTNYNWSTGQNTQTITINNSGTYWVSITNPSTGCRSVDTVHVYHYQDKSYVSSGCDCVKVNSTYPNAIDYTWHDSIFTPIRLIDSSGVYQVNIESVSGCNITNTYNVTIHNKPFLDLGEDITGCFFDEFSIELKAQNAVNYLWSVNNLIAQSIKVTQPGVYWVKTTNMYGCTAIDTIEINVSIKPNEIVFPNIITSNNDGINEAIDFGKLGITKLDAKIYNRWGTLIFETTNPNSIWEPKNANGTYFLIGEYTIDCGENETIKTAKQYITVISD